jgi:hypothetical protein
MNPAGKALSSRWLTCRTWCGAAPGPKKPQRVAQGLEYLAPPLARSVDYHLHVRGFKERGTTTTPFDRRRNLQLQINQKMYRHCPTFEMVVECV